MKVGAAVDELIARLDTLVAPIVTPSHQREDPVKARVDDDNAAVLAAFLAQQYEARDWGICDVEAGYVVPAPARR